VVRALRDVEALASLRAGALQVASELTLDRHVASLEAVLREAVA
jgi:hypothetical protein